MACSRRPELCSKLFDAAVGWSGAITIMQVGDRACWTSDAAAINQEAAKCNRTAKVTTTFARNEDLSDYTGLNYCQMEGVCHSPFVYTVLGSDNSCIAHAHLSAEVLSPFAAQFGDAVPLERVRMYDSLRVARRPALQWRYRYHTMPLTGPHSCRLHLGDKLADARLFRPYDWFPRTLLLPEDAEVIADQLLDHQPNAWLVKHVACGQGQGLHKHDGSTVVGPDTIVQQQIQPVLFNGVAWTFRLHTRLRVAPGSAVVMVAKMPLIRMAPRPYHRTARHPGAMDNLVSNSAVTRREESEVRAYPCEEWPWKMASAKEIFKDTPLRWPVVFEEALSIVRTAYRIGSKRQDEPCDTTFMFDFMLDAENGGHVRLIEVQQPGATVGGLPCLQQQAVYDSLNKAWLAYDAGNVSHEGLVLIDMAELTPASAESHISPRPSAQISQGAPADLSAASITQQLAHGRPPVVIVAAEVWPFCIPRRALYSHAAGNLTSACAVLLRLRSNGGLEAFGETSMIFTDRSGETLASIADVLGRYFGPRLIGQDAMQMDSILDQLDRGLTSDRYAWPYSRAAVDIALHDLVGKATNLSVAALLGGPLDAREAPLGAGSYRLRVGGSLSISDTDTLVDHAKKRVLQEGYGGVTLKGSRDATGDIDRFMAVRRALGPSVPIEIDPNQAYSVAQAIRVATTLEPHGLALLEQPVAWYDLEGLGAVQAATTVPVAADEAVMCEPEVRHVARLGAARFATIKLPRVGGLREAVRMFHAATASGLKCNLGSKHPFGVGTAAMAAFAASHNVDEPIGYGSPLERCTDDILVKPIDFHDGYLTLPRDGPGLGVHVDQDKVRTYLVGNPIFVGASGGTISASAPHDEL